MPFEGIDLTGYLYLLPKADGPGNGQVLRRHDLGFHPDWEAFITSVVDYLLTRRDVDEDGIISNS